MTILFIHLPHKEFNIAVERIVNALGIAGPIYGDSTHSLGGIYAQIHLLGTKIKIEQNAYDHEEQYNYCLFIDKDIFSPVLTSEHNIGMLSGIIAGMLHQNLNIEVGMETNGTFCIYRER